jgi:hypothetical protein
MFWFGNDGKDKAITDKRNSFIVFLNIMKLTTIGTRLVLRLAKYRVISFSIEEIRKV